MNVLWLWTWTSVRGQSRFCLWTVQGWTTWRFDQWCCVSWCTGQVTQKNSSPQFMQSMQNLFDGKTSQKHRILIWKMQTCIKATPERSYAKCFCFTDLNKILHGYLIFNVTYNIIYDKSKQLLEWSNQYIGFIRKTLALQHLNMLHRTVTWCKSNNSVFYQCFQARCRAAGCKWCLAMH